MNLTEERKNKIKSVYWDYNVDPIELYLILLGKKNAEVFFNKEKILLRLIERLGWYELIDLLGKEYLAQNLNKTIIDKIRNPQLRYRYESIREILRGEAISATGWSNKNRNRLRASILSDRRYGS